MPNKTKNKNLGRVVELLERIEHRLYESSLGGVVWPAGELTKHWELVAIRAIDGVAELAIVTNEAYLLTVVFNSEELHADMSQSRWWELGVDQLIVIPAGIERPMDVLLTDRSENMVGGDENFEEFVEWWNANLEQHYRHEKAFARTRPVHTKSRGYKC